MEALKTSVEANSLEGVYAALRQLQTDKSIPENIISDAVNNRNLEMVAALLGAKSRQDDATYSMSYLTLWHAIITAKDLPITQLLIRAGYEPFPAGKDTALHWAAEAGDLPLLEYIWDLASSRGININVTDENGWTPLHQAAYNCNDAAVRFLLQRGANVNISNDYDRNAILLLLQSEDARNPENAESVTSITEACINAGLRLEDFGGWTPLMDASFFGVAAAVKVLLERGANIDTKVPENGKNALHIAIQWGSFDCAQILISAGADINAKDAAGNTPLHVACKNSQREGGVTATLDVLLECGADVSMLAAAKESCLHIVVRKFCGHCSGALPWNQHRVREAKGYAACALRFIQKLLKAGAQPHLLNLKGFTALQIIDERFGAAVLNQHKDVFAPIIVTLIKGGDFYSWRGVPEGCPGLETAIEVVWNKRPEMLSQLFVKMVPGEQERVRMTLRCLQRYLPNEAVRMQIICKMYSSSDV